MECLDASLISAIDQRIENTKPSSKSDTEDRSVTVFSVVHLINLLGSRTPPLSLTIKTGISETK